MEDYEHAVFISYAWGGESEEIANQIDRTLQKRGMTIVRDKRDLGYKGSIREFMERIGQGNAIIVIISDKYLRSKNCMFELVEIADNKQFLDRVFPIVLSDALIYDPSDRLDYVEYWQDQKNKLDAKFRKLKDHSQTQGILDELNDYDRFRSRISEMTSILKDMNTLTPNLHQKSYFNELYVAIRKRLQESPKTTTGEDRQLLSVMDVMIKIDDAVKLILIKDLKDPKDIKLKSVILEKFMDPKYLERLPILDTKGRIKYMIHRSLIDRFLVEKVSCGLSIDELTLANMLVDKSYKILLSKSFITLPANFNLDYAKVLMEETSNCSDIFITDDGTPRSKTIGWVTNVGVGYYGVIVPDISVMDVMIRIADAPKLILDVDPDYIRLKSDILEEILDSHNRERLPILDPKGRIKYMAHRSLIDKFIARKAGEGANVDILTLQDMLDDKGSERTLSKTFCTVRAEQNLSFAKSEMEKIFRCADIFVTRDGTPNTPVIGWITDTIVEKLAVVL